MADQVTLNATEINTLIERVEYVLEHDLSVSSAVSYTHLTLPTTPYV